MSPAVGNTIQDERPVVQLTRDWGDWTSVSLYLSRCQVDTPPDLIQLTWDHVKRLRPQPGKVIDFGAGDARFSKQGVYQEYLGYEIDEERCISAQLPDNVRLINRCAFSDEIIDADLCIGNPPFVRNQDLPYEWRQHAANVLFRRIGVSVSGIANAWQYFFLLGLASVKPNGLCALIVPYEWVSRPSVRALHNYIEHNRWHVTVYRLSDRRFGKVLTTSSITIVDKARQDGLWEYFQETTPGEFRPLPSPTGAASGILPYARKSDIPAGAPRAMRGLSPGTQKVLTLTEGERIRNGLRIDSDVVPCVTSLRNLPSDSTDLDTATFQRYFRDKGQKCWLIRTDKPMTSALALYLHSVPSSDYQTATCLERESWWKFIMPPTPQVLLAQSFKKAFPKRVRNTVGARAVGSVCGIYNVTEEQIRQILGAFGDMDLRKRVVAHANAFRKVEINQLNALLRDSFGDSGLCG
ncbi:MAG: hypothetical protein OXF79_28120 [Chloroflexi bacterium]|nr:hypothetical protein [Chloroflexota bacterium]